MVVADVPVSQLAFPLTDGRYMRYSTAQEFSVAAVRIVTRVSHFEWPGLRMPPYATGESFYLSVSASDWERVLREVRLIEQGGFVTVRATPASQRVQVQAPDTRQFRLFLEERKFVARNWELLTATYQGRYIAVLGTSILDSDREFSALASRVYARFGYQPIFMPFVSTRKGVYRIPSPRIVR